MKRFVSRRYGRLRWSHVCAVLTLLAVVVAPGSLSAQSRREPPSPSPQQRLAPATRSAIEQLVDSLVAERLPGDAVRDKVAEGVLKGADDGRILLAVRSLAARLRESRTLLGPTATEDELKAAASALFAGVDAGAITRLTDTQRQRATGGSLTMALTIVTELAMRRIPSDLAVSSIESLLQRGARDADLHAFRSAFERDLRQGRAPREAISSSVRTTLNGLGRSPE